ncbi:QcrA and Rieske domain-containing protein [Sphaerisporangium sp. NPDC004334]
MCTKSGQECQALSAVTDDRREVPSPADAAAGTTRRAAIVGVGSAGLATVLAACAGRGAISAGIGSSSSGASAPSGGATPPTATTSGTSLAKTSDIPKDGGKVLPDHKIVIVQPAVGKFRAFSAVCTHRGCMVADVSSGMINCPCHGSMFWLDGKVMGGPATKPLTEIPIKVDGDTISLA